MKLSEMSFKNLKMFRHLTVICMHLKDNVIITSKQLLKVVQNIIPPMKLSKMLYVCDAKQKLEFCFKVAF